MYKVYWTLEGNDCSECYTELIEALNQTNYLRAIGMSYVAMVGENMHQVGQLGVDNVEKGKLPSGEDYTWMKRRKQ